MVVEQCMVFLEFGTYGHFDRVMRCSTLAGALGDGWNRFFKALHEAVEHWRA